MPMDEIPINDGEHGQCDDFPTANKQEEKVSEFCSLCSAYKSGSCMGK